MILLALVVATLAALPAATPSAAGERIRVVDSQFGRILADSTGQAVYAFDVDPAGRSTCKGACARAWPPVLAHGRPRAGKGVRAKLLATTRRADGRRQVTYGGRPLYLYVSDAPGRVLCHDVREFGGLWQVLRASGAIVP